MSVTSFLSTVLIMANAGKQLSRVSYLKAIDWFLMGNAVFVFLSLVEYLFVLNISASISPWSEKKRKVSPTVNKAVLWLTAYYLLTRCEVRTRKYNAEDFLTARVTTPSFATVFCKRHEDNDMNEWIGSLICWPVICI